MESPLEVIRRPFVERLRTGRTWTRFAFEIPRPAAALLLAVVLPLLLALAALIEPAIARLMTRPEAVQATFARFISGLITAATIAVGFSTLALRRGIKGIGEIQDHTRDDEEYRSRVRQSGGHDALPITIGPFMSVVLGDIAVLARRARDGADPKSLAIEHDGVTLERFLDAVESEAILASREVHDRGADPAEMLRAAYDFEQTYTSHLTRRFARDQRLSPWTREALGEMARALHDNGIARGYVKTLDTQWGLSRMSHAIMLTSFVAIFATAALVLLYDESVLGYLGPRVAALLIALVLAIDMLPLGIFVSYSIRFIFVNQHSLPIGGFALGPETTHVDRHPARRERTPARGGRA